MKKEKAILQCLGAVLLILTAFISCNNGLVPVPVIDQITSGISADVSLTPPENLTATHGGYKSVTLTWKASSNAAQYKVYSAKTPYDNFVQIAETKDASCEIIVTENAGSNKYYRVAAVNSQGKESQKSDFVFGSSLATPVITRIDQSEDGTSSTVFWWMENCDNNTYLKNVNYEITVYDETKTKTIGDTYVINGQILKDGSEELYDAVTSIQINNLEPKTKYFFKVEAYTKQNVEKREIGDLIDAETAHLLTPAAPQDVTATKGTSTQSVSVSWTLPEFVEVSTAYGTYERHPLYFSVKRKLMGADDSTYEVLAEKISCVAETDIGKKTYRFSCIDSGKNGDCITTQPSVTTDTEQNYPDYLPESKVTFIDKTPEQGKQYTYKVQSYSDDTTKTRSDDTTCTGTADGWKISVAKFYTEANYHYTSEEKTGIESISIIFHTDFVDFIDESAEDASSPYLYTITANYSSLDESVNETRPVTSLSSLKALKEYTYTFENLAENQDLEGYYKYTLDIASPDGNTVYVSVPAGERFTVTADPTKIPKIENFSVKDGFADKYEVSWSYSQVCQYTISWQNFDKDNNLLGEDSYTLTEDDVLSFVDGNIETFNLPAASGDRAKFTLIANSGLEATQTLEDTYETLGTPVPVIKNYDYSTITVSWNAVQKADAPYTVSAFYDDKTVCEDELLITEGAEQNTEITEQDGVYTCVITNPYGYDMEKVSGLPIKLTVTAKNSTTESTASATPVVKTVGPAALNTTFVDSTMSNNLDQSKNIVIQWDKVDGAAGYIIQRILYKDGEPDPSNLDETADKYFYDCEKNELTVSSGEPDSSRVTVKLTDTKFVLTDKYAEPTENNSYHANQSKIPLGLPYGYIVLPVKENGTADDFIFDDVKQHKLLNESKIVYGKPADPEAIENDNLTDTIGSTYGYGLEVTAAKSESSETISITWKKPFENPDTVPILYRRQNKGQNWSIVKALDGNTTTLNDPLTDCDKTKSYYYAVQYAVSNDTPLSYLPCYDKNVSVKDLRYSEKNPGFDESTINESLNKGYLFFIDYSASYNGTILEDGTYDTEDEFYYSENISHKMWDFTERARGPVSYTISAKNLNLVLDYVKLADINVNPATGIETYLLNVEKDAEGKDTDVLADNSNDTRITKSGSSLIVSPIGITTKKDGETNGILQILRSSKTFYKLESKRDFSVNGNTKTISFNKENCGYRQITDTELAKSVGLIIADSLYKAGIPEKYSSDFFAQPKDDATNNWEGFSITHTSWANYSQWGFNGLDYKNKFEPGCSSTHPESYISDFTLNAGNSSKVEGAKSHTLYYLPPLEIQLSHNSNLNSYNKKIIFEAGAAGTSKKWNLYISQVVGTKSDGSKDTKSLVKIDDKQTEFLKYFPYDIGNKHESGDKTCNTALQTYQGDWWN